jgi:hypothetical protein
LPTQLDNGTVAVVAIKGMAECLTAQECERVGRYLLNTANDAYDAKRRVQYLTDPSTRNAPNLCKACGHLNDPHNRGWCRCEHCRVWMDRGPFPGESMEAHQTKRP